MEKKRKKEISIHCYAVTSQITCLRENKKIYQYNIVKLKNNIYIYINMHLVRSYLLRKIMYILQFLKNNKR